MPLYNSGLTLKSSVKSILHQSYKNYEVVFIDGGSNDDTLKIITDFKQLNNHIQLLTEPDNGIYDAMNKGISIAAGQWLYFMGGDDHLKSDNILNEIHYEIKNGTFDLIYGNVLGSTSKTRYVYDTLSKVLSQGIHHQSIFYKKSLFNQLGLYNIKFKVASDYHLTLKAFFNNSYNTKYINLDIAIYGENGLSSINYDYKFFSYHYKFLAKNSSIKKIDDPQQCLQNSIYCCLYLAKTKKNFLFAWINLIYYLTGLNGLKKKFRIKTLLRMIFWSLKF